MKGSWVQLNTVMGTQVDECKVKFTQVSLITFFTEHKFVPTQVLSLLTGVQWHKPVRKLTDTFSGCLPPFAAACARGRAPGRQPHAFAEQPHGAERAVRWSGAGHALRLLRARDARPAPLGVEHVGLEHHLRSASVAAPSYYGLLFGPLLLGISLLEKVFRKI